VKLRDYIRSVEEGKNKLKQYKIELAETSP